MTANPEHTGRQNAQRFDCPTERSGVNVLCVVKFRPATE